MALMAYQVAWEALGYLFQRNSAEQRKGTKVVLLSDQAINQAIIMLCQEQHVNLLALDHTRTNKKTIVVEHNKH